MAYIKGDDVFLYINTDVGLLPVSCLIDNPLDEISVPLETTSRGSGGFRTYIPTIQDYSININGYLFTGVGVFSYEDLKLLKRSGTPFEWQIRSNDGVIGESGTAFISALSLGSPSGGVVTFSATLMPYSGGLSNILLWSQNGLNVVSQNGENMIQIK